MLRFLTLLSFFIAFAWAAKPMESIEKYNVILVHGAADKRSGLDCKETIGVAYDPVFSPEETEYLNLIGGYGSAWFWDKDFHGGFLYQDEGNGATGTVSGLRDWLTEKVFEEDKSAVYLQRSFINPANSPINNAKELGNRKWQGDKGCASRRALIEEAQEVKANGRDSLKKYRTNPKYYYENNLLPPSRNILIAHSMGGVVSPNEGTECLC